MSFDNKSKIFLVKQLSMWAWPLNAVTTFSWDAKQHLKFNLQWWICRFNWL